ncbi:tripartite tricarboxylate transporter substrate binding protein [Pigmentiphaga soli]|uniref:Tripartite tricarboxylate transporter substrate binding protein n=1 Tax=Pigmentiphaga soli TaxID=1007095 RepID=A0ABP8HD23_9BURK
MKPFAPAIRAAARWQQALACAAVAGLALAAAPAVHADNGAYPNKPVRVIVPFPPGGGTDVVARMFATRLSQSMGQPFVIDNRGGATGTIGTNAVANAAPDGYTLLVGSLSSHVLAPLTLETDAKAADPVKDFTPIGMLAYHPMVLNVNPSVKANTVAELVAETKRRPMFYSSIGTGSLFHFAGAEFDQLTGAQASHVPYRGAAPALADLLAGQVQMMFDTIQSSLPHIQKGALKPIAVTAKKRSPLLPNVPTLAEEGLADFDIASWVGMLAPAGTPKEVVDRLAAELDKLARDRDFVAQAARTGTDVPRMTPAEFGAILVKDQRQFAERFQRINLAGK